MNIFNSYILILNSIQSSPSKHIIIQTHIYPITPLLQVFFELSSLTIAYPNLVFTSSSLTFLVPLYANFIPPSHHTVLCKLHSLPFLTKFILLPMCMVCLV